MCPVFPSRGEDGEIAAVRPGSAAVARASKGIAAACMMCKENNSILQECYIQKLNFQQVFKALRGRDCLEKYGKNKILTSGAVCQTTPERWKVLDILLWVGNQRV